MVTKFSQGVDVAVIVAIDPGTRYIGLAVSNPEQTLSFPLTVIPARPQLEAVQFIVSTVEQRKAERIVVGRPTSLKGKTTPQTHLAQQLASVLRKNVTIPVEYMDERLSTASTRRIPGRVTSKGHRPDASAAALILDAYLGRLNTQHHGRI